MERIDGPRKGVLSSDPLVFFYHLEIPSAINSVAGARSGADPAYSWPTPGDKGVRGDYHSLGHWISLL